MRGETDQGSAIACADCVNATTKNCAPVETKCGSTNATAETSGCSELGQQDIEQSVISPVSCPQSICESGAVWLCCR